MDLQLTGKIAMITGASSGIGAATARVLAEEGADVVIAFGENERGARETAIVVESNGRRAWLARMDVSQPSSVEAAVAHLAAVVPQIDLLILCAGHNVVTPVRAITPDEWSRVIGVNLGGTFYVAQAMLPFVRDGGSIVTVASVAAHTGAPHHAHYAAAKAGVVNLTKSLARTLAPRIRVNCVAPGLTRTPMGDMTIASLAPDYAAQKIPVQRFASPEEIGRCIAFVASPLCGFMTGATIDINGGREMR